MVGASGRAGKASKAQKRGIFLVSDKRQKRTQIILTSKTSKGVVAWLAMAGTSGRACNKQGPESRTMVRVEHSLKINTTLNLRSNYDQRTRIILA